MRCRITSSLSVARYLSSTRLVRIRLERCLSASQRLVYRQSLDFSNAAMKSIYEQGPFWSVPSPNKYATWDEQKKVPANLIAKSEIRRGLWQGMSLAEAASIILQTKLNPNWELTERQAWLESIKKEAHEFAERKMTQRNQKPTFTCKPSPLRQSWTPPSPQPQPAAKKVKKRFTPTIQKFRYEMFTWPLLMNEEIELYEEKEEKKTKPAKHVLISESEWKEKKIELMQVPSYLVKQRKETLAAMDRVRSVLASLNA